MDALRTGEPPLGDLTSEEHSWLATALAHLNRIYKKRGAGSPGKEAFCIFEVGKVYVQFLASWDAEKLACEAASGKSIPEIGAILTTESDEALRGFGFNAPEISPNYSQIIEINGVEDLAYAARLAFRVLKQVYRVANFSSATFKERIPLGNETVHVGISPPREITGPTADSETVAERFTRLVSNDPQFEEVKNTGKAFVIVGVRPPRKD